MIRRSLGLALVLLVAGATAHVDAANLDAGKKKARVAS